MRSGVHVATSTPTIEVGAVAVVSIGLGRRRIGGPVRVVDTADERTRVGFTYATLPGHPECGEESFDVILDDGIVRFVLSGVSRPATRLARLGGPVTTTIQRVISDRYARALVA
ncbi:hypothetical protein MP11Mi_29350 [Gordonia sp. MP11Mi]|uniref:DUF1990 domain-containing protein n=2 Tax=Gordonia sp. MP11Mi TaxID=3022769 RepID=A0AA97GWL0_9ACTN